MAAAQEELAKQIRKSENSRKPVNATLTTDEKVLARITDGIYRQPSSALRELISNAYDADATEVQILTDAPRFSEISIRDDGMGLSPETIEYLIRHIGGSAKHEAIGKSLGVTSKKDIDESPFGRKLIGKMGIGLFSVAQFTRHFLIISKTKGDNYRTVADITLSAISGKQKTRKKGKKNEIETGSARIWREFAPNKDSHGTEIKLLELLPRTRAELASDDLWMKVEYGIQDTELVKINPPTWHIGRMVPKQEELLERQPNLPWDNSDSPQMRFKKLVQVIRSASENATQTVDLDTIFDKYLQTVWTLALSAPIKYVESHPFDLQNDGKIQFYSLGNKAGDQAALLEITGKETPRKKLKLQSPDGPTGKEEFHVFVDGVELFRPILFKDLPKSQHAITDSLLFLGKEYQRFEKKPIELSGGPLKFEAYLFWSSRIIPSQHQGVMLRVGNASGALFDKTFMGYQVSEQTRLRQITAEIFILEGLEEAINIDRESFNFAHPHYQYLVKWLHSALRQLANKHKQIGSQIRSKKVENIGKKTLEKVEGVVDEALRAKGIEDIPEVLLIEEKSELQKLRKSGTIALLKENILTSAHSKNTQTHRQQQGLNEKKMIGIIQLLSGWGLLDSLDYNDQEQLAKEILKIILIESH